MGSQISLNHLRFVFSCEGGDRCRCASKLTHAGSCRELTEWWYHPLRHTTMGNYTWENISIVTFMISLINIKLKGRDLGRSRVGHPSRPGLRPGRPKSIPKHWSCFRCALQFDQSKFRQGRRVGRDMRYVPTNATYIVGAKTFPMCSDVFHQGTPANYTVNTISHSVGFVLFGYDAMSSKNDP